MSDKKYPSFFAIHGRKPIAGKDFDPERGLCQDDHDYFAGIGQYSDEEKTSVDRDGSQIFIKRPYAEIKEIKGLSEPNDNVIRIYCQQYPEAYTLQIRTHKPTDKYGEGKPRDMIATTWITIEEVEELLREMKAYRDGKPSAFDHNNK